MFVSPRHRAMLLVLSVLASPASAQWTPIADVPATDIFSMFAKGDTVIAGADTALYLSTNAGATWTLSSKPVAGVTSLQAVRVHNGRLYAGTFGQGVFVSDDHGLTWQAYNQGLVGGFLNSQLAIGDLAVRGDSVYAATLGAGVYVRGLTGATAWSHFGNELEPNQASNVLALTLGGSRLLASAGANGMVFTRDPGAPDWTVSFLDNVGIRAGLQAMTAAYNGHGWVVATSRGTFRSTLGQSPWSLTDLGLGPLLSVAFTTIGREFFAAIDIVNAVFTEHSSDDGATWEILDEQPNAFVYQIAASRGVLFAGRADGLWRRSNFGLAVPPDGALAGLAFANAGQQPVREQARLRFTLHHAGPATIDFLDVAGRRATARIEGTWPAGAHEVSWDTHGLEPGVYEALLNAEGEHAAVRIVHVR